MKKTVKQIFALMLLGIFVTANADTTTINTQMIVTPSEAAPTATTSTTKVTSNSQSGDTIKCVIKNRKKVCQKEEPKPTLIQAQVKQNKKILAQPFSIILYNANYFMPFYYSTHLQPSNTNPNNEKLNHTEVKYQISFAVPIWQNIIDFKDHELSLYAAYTQLSYWQLYQKSAFFRETDYEPELFFKIFMHKNFLFRAGVSHQSNGRGGLNERSWNRVFGSVEYANHRLFVGIKPWALIFTKESTELYNPNITTYLGYEDVYIGYKFRHDIKLFLQVRNIEHASNYMTEITSLTIPISNHIQFFFQYFHGYGQSLIEYNVKTNSVGVGFALNQYF